MERASYSFEKGSFGEPGERIFIFVDETGDPGHPEQRDSSASYQLNITVANRRGVSVLMREFSRFRYFRSAEKELDRYQRFTGILIDLLRASISSGVVRFYSFCLDKRMYVGPYLKKIRKGRFDYDPKRFRNFVIRMSLETLFSKEMGSINSPPNEYELVFDRFLSNEDDEQNLKGYLRGNFRLPNFLHIVQVDSNYSDPVQVTDLVGKFVKDLISGESRFDIGDLVRIYHLEDPDVIVERKKPGHP